MNENKFNVGDGATMCFWSDRHACTVSAVSANGKTVTIQRDIVTRVDKNGMSDCQDWRYESDKNAPESVFTLRKNGRYVERGTTQKDGTAIISGRHEYYDYTF